MQPTMKTIIWNYLPPPTSLQARTLCLVLSIVKRLIYADFQKPMKEMIVNSKGEISIVKFNFYSIEITCF